VTVAVAAAPLPPPPLIVTDVVLVYPRPAVVTLIEEIDPLDRIAVACAVELVFPPPEKAK
jgi:hypothetical protein